MDEITVATSFLTYVIPMIESTSSLRVVVRKLQKLLAAARSLRVELTTEPLPTYGNISLEEIYRDYFYRPKRSSHPSNGLPFLLLDAVDVAIAISTLAIRTFDEESSRKEKEVDAIPEGEMWSMWISTLTRLMKKYGLPHEVRKDVDKRKGLPSPFVRLVRELQRCMPRECRKFTQSDDALAQGISRARKAPKKRHVTFDDAQSELTGYMTIKLVIDT
jgi:hypothetical protein